jgi:sec-independent protein translocase protein TatA
MPNIGVPELLILLVILLLIFGPKRLPGLGRQLGSGMREFKDSVTGKSRDDDSEEDAEEPLRSLTPPPAAPVDPARAGEPAAPVAAERGNPRPPTPPAA